MIHRVARSRPSDDDREPEDRVTIPIASDRHRHPILRPALRERRPRHSLLLLLDAWFPLFPERNEVRRDRRAPGRGGRWQAGLRRTLAFGADRLATGRRRSSDRRRFRRHLRYKRITSARISLRSLRLCGYESGRVGGIGEPKKRTDAISIKETIRVYLRDLRAHCDGERVGFVAALCLCVSVVQPWLAGGCSGFSRGANSAGRGA